MSNKATIPSPLQSKVVALPESRQLDVLADLFERRQAEVVRVPLVSILDAPDQAAVIDWIKSFIADPPDYFVILTGEGVRRLVASAQREGLMEEFVKALAEVCKICRGPKPGRALKELNLGADILAVEPTTSGIITTLETMNLSHSRISVQLYGDDPNTILMDYLSNCDLQHRDVVAPYIYASNSDTERVQGLITQLYTGAIDLIAFTSKSQISRLFNVAKKQGVEAELKQGLDRTKIAAIGPIVRDELLLFDCKADIMPTSSYFMKPLVRAAETMYATETRENEGRSSGDTHNLTD
ncbi:MAG: uroporphyrinogen-III synthase [Pseudohongiellaceae bacterium]